MYIQEPRLGRRTGRQLLQPDDDDRGPELLGLGLPEGHHAGARGGARGVGGIGDVSEHHAAVELPQGRAHVDLQETVATPLPGTAREPCELLRLRPLVPARSPGHLERTPLRQALLHLNYKQPQMIITISLPLRVLVFGLRVYFSTIFLAFFFFFRDTTFCIVNCYLNSNAVCALQKKGAANLAPLHPRTNIYLVLHHLVNSFFINIKNLKEFVNDPRFFFLDLNLGI